MVIQKGRDNPEAEQLTDDLRLKYLILLCKFKPDHVVFVMKANMFPLDYAYKICERYNNLLAMAYIKSRIGQLDTAIKLYMQVSLKPNQSR